MTGGDAHASTPRAEPPGDRTAPGIALDAVGRIGRDPLLAVPFLVAGVLLAGLDWARRHDPIPTRLVETAGDATVNVTFLVYPSGAPMTARPLGALVDLKPQYLLWAVGLELLALLAVGVAGWLTFVRAGSEGAAETAEAAGPPVDRLLPYLGFVLVVRLGFHLLGRFDGLGLLSLFAILVALWAFVRLFAAPALVVAGADLRTAVDQSARLTSGDGATVLGLVLGVGIAAWLLGSVPVVGALASTAVVAPIHAVAVVVLVNRTTAA